jgi:hypothetical protein
VGIRLVPDIPNNFILGALEDAMKGYCKFYSAKARSKVSASNLNSIDYCLSYFLS